MLSAGHLAIFTTYLPQVATFFPVALAGIETVTVTEFLHARMELIIKYPLSKMG